LAGATVVVVWPTFEGVVAADPAGAEVAVTPAGVAPLAAGVVAVGAGAVVELEWLALLAPSDELSGLLLAPAQPEAAREMATTPNPQARLHHCDLFMLVTTTPVVWGTKCLGLGRRARRIDRRPSPDLNRPEAGW
jgi:hypothetical protein